MRNVYGIKAAAFLLLVSAGVMAEDYPDMIGTWSGQVRVVSSGTGEVAKGGMLISEFDLRVMIEHQDQESFMGTTRNSTMSKDDPSNRVWGTIRSNGEEALFLTAGGARGQMWFNNPNTFEYCVTNLQEKFVQAYCAVLTKTE